MDPHAINKIYYYLNRLKWKRILNEYESLNYKISEPSDLVYIEWEDILPPIRKRLVNNAVDGNIYHIISKMSPNVSKIARCVEEDSSKEILDHFIVGKIPKRYKYSSGLNAIDGFYSSERDF